MTRSRAARGGLAALALTVGIGGTIEQASGAGGPAAETPAPTPSSPASPSSSGAWPQAWPAVDAAARAAGVSEKALTAGLAALHGDAAGSGGWIQSIADAERPVADRRDASGVAIRAAFAAEHQAQALALARRLARKLGVDQARATAAVRQLDQGMWR